MEHTDGIEDRQPRVRSARTVEVLEITTVEGAWEQSVGTDIVREVVYLYRPDGTLITRIDPHPESRT